MKNFLLVFFLVISLPHVANAFLDEEIFKAEAKTKITDVLTDPESARFKDIRVIKNSQGEEYVCGQVNSKNRMGGYNGFVAFSYSKDNLIIYGDEMDPEKLFQYLFSGCAGPEQEALARLNKQEQEELERFKKELPSACNLLWDFLENVIVNKKSADDAFNEYLNSVKKRYEERGLVFPSEQEQATRSQLYQALKETLADKSQTNAIRKSDSGFKTRYIDNCISRSVSLYKNKTQSARKSEDGRSLVNNFYYDNYNDMIRNKIKQSVYKYIDDPKFKPGTLYLTLVLTADGILKNVSIVEEKTKANAFLREIGIKSVKEAAPFEPFPAGIRNYPELSFNVVLSFQGDRE